MSAGGSLKKQFEIKTPNYKPFFDRYGESSIERIRKNLRSTGTNASGSLSRSLRKESTKTRIAVFALYYAFWQEEGRKPTKNSGDGSLQKAIRKWIDIRGIKPVLTGKETPEQIEKKKQGLAYIIARRIHIEGTLLHKLGERRELWTNVFSNESIENLKEEMSAETVNVLSDVIRQLR